MPIPEERHLSHLKLRRLQLELEANDDVKRVKKVEVQLKDINELKRRATARKEIREKNRVAYFAMLARRATEIQRIWRGMLGRRKSKYRLLCWKRIVRWSTRYCHRRVELRKDSIQKVNLIFDSLKSSVPQSTHALEVSLSAVVLAQSYKRKRSMMIIRRFILQVALYKISSRKIASKRIFRALRYFHEMKALIQRNTKNGESSTLSLDMSESLCNSTTNFIRRPSSANIFKGNVNNTVLKRSADSIFQCQKSICDFTITNKTNKKDIVTARYNEYQREFNIELVKRRAMIEASKCRKQKEIEEAKLEVQAEKDRIAARKVFLENLREKQLVEARTHAKKLSEKAIADKLYKDQMQLIREQERRENDKKKIEAEVELRRKRHDFIDRQRAIHQRAMQREREADERAVRDRREALAAKSAEFRERTLARIQEVRRKMQSNSMSSSSRSSTSLPNQKSASSMKSESLQFRLPRTVRIYDDKSYNSLSYSSIDLSGCSFDQKSVNSMERRYVFYVDKAVQSDLPMEIESVYSFSSSVRLPSIAPTTYQYQSKRRKEMFPKNFMEVNPAEEDDAFF